MRRLGFLKYLFTAVGIALLAGAAALALGTRAFLSRAVAADGIVVDLEASRSSDGTTWRPVVAFTTPDGRRIEFTSSTGSNPAAYARGEQVEVLFDPADPRKPRIRGFLDLWFAPTLLGGMGAVFSLVGGGIFLVGASGRRRAEALRRRGTRIQATIQRVELNEAFSMNGRHPFRIVAQWLDPASNQVHVFESENLWFDPSPYIQGKEIGVLVERRNPRRYLVDVSFLPKLAR